MRILLANSYFLERDANEQKIMKPYPPLGMLYISAVLKQAGHTVKVFDGTFSALADFGTSLQQVKPDLVGIYANVITRDAAIEMARQACAVKLPVIFGGPDATGDPEEYLGTGAIAVVRGEGEHTAVELVAHLESRGPGADLGDIAGLIIGNGNGLQRTAERPRIDDLDVLPLPDRGAVDLERYVEAWRRRHGYASLSLITSRGCPYHCTWCSKEIFGETFRQRKPEGVLDEIQELQDVYGTDQLWLADDILTLNQKWVRSWSQGMVERDLVIPFECLSRVDRVDADTVQDLRRAGCFRVWYGAESGSERVVKSMRKDFNTERVRESIRLTKAAGIQVGLFILMGYPGEKLRDLLQTMGMIRELAPHYCGGSVAFPIKGTQFYEDVRQMLAPDYAWSRRNENRLSFRGRYPAAFYWFAVRLLHNWSSFWSCRTRAQGGAGPIGRLLHAAKFMVAGAGVIAIGLWFDLKSRIRPEPPLRPAATVTGPGSSGTGDADDAGLRCSDSNAG